MRRYAQIAAVVVCLIPAVAVAGAPRAQGASVDTSAGAASRSKSACPTNEFEAQYYTGTTATGTPVTERCEYAIGGSYGTTAPVTGVTAGDFSVAYTGTVSFPTSTTYTVAADTAGTTITLSIDGTTLLSYPTAGWAHYATTASVTAGTHTVKATIGVPTTSGVENVSITSNPLGTAATDYFAQTSFWNQPVPSTATVDTRSAGWVNALTSNTAITSMYVNSNAWSTPVYTAPTGTATTSIAVSNSNLHITIPYTTSYQPSPDTDAHLAVIDATTGCEYEFEAFNPSTLTADAEATYHVHTGSGAHVSGPGHAGGELSYLGGLITPTDVTSGTITHALRYALPSTDTAPQFAYPGTRSDGATTGAVPEGTQLRLNPTLNLTTYNLTPFQTMVAKALQTYGAYDADQSSNFALYAESTIDGSTYTQTIAPLPATLISQLQFLTPTTPSTDYQMDTNTDTTCNQPH